MARYHTVRAATEFSMTVHADGHLGIALVRAVTMQASVQGDAPCASRMQAKDNMQL